MNVVVLVCPSYVIQHDRHAVGVVTNLSIPSINVVVDLPFSRVRLAVQTSQGVTVAFQVNSLQIPVVSVVMVPHMRSLLVRSVSNHFQDVGMVMTDVSVRNDQSIRSIALNFRRINVCEVLIRFPISLKEAIGYLVPGLNARKVKIRFNVFWCSMVAALNDVVYSPVNVISYVLGVGIVHQVNFIELVNPSQVVKHDRSAVRVVGNQFVALTNVVLDGSCRSVRHSVLVGGSVAFAFQVNSLQIPVVSVVMVPHMRSLLVRSVSNHFQDVGMVMTDVSVRNDQSIRSIALNFRRINVCEVLIRFPISLKEAIGYLVPGLNARKVKIRFNVFWCSMVAALNDVVYSPVNVISYVLGVGIVHQVNFIELVNPSQVVKHDRSAVRVVGNQFVALTNVVLDGSCRSVRHSVLVGGSVAFAFHVVRLQGLIVGIVNILNVGILLFSRISNYFVNVGCIVGNVAV